MRRKPPALRALLTIPALGVAALAAWPLSTRAESWCADPLWVHEWGVQVFGPGGARRATAGPVALPGYFHDRPSSSRASLATGAPVRGMDVDGGERALPVLHFYSGRNWEPIPVGIEVGFTQGDASVWYPQVDLRRAAADANGPAARAARAALLRTRSARAAGRLGTPPVMPPGDPTRQHAWDRLTLTRSPLHTRAGAQVPWVDRARGFGEALWVNNAQESERFVFYEARTSETQAVRLERGPTYAPGRRHVLMRNVGRLPVHDVFLVHREGQSTFLFYAPSIPAGATAGLVLEDHRVDAAALRAGTRDRLRGLLVDAHEASAPAGVSWASGDCVMQRDPAIPVDAAEGHRLYASEADLLLETWGARFFDAPGTTLVYREDPRYLDSVMPLSIYTDMFHYVKTRRAGLALVEGASLP